MERRTFLRQFVLPPTIPEVASTRQLHDAARLRALFVAMAIATDLLLLALFHDSALMRPEVVRVFAAVNIGLLGVDFAITFGVLARTRRGYYPLLAVCAVIEVVTSVVWIQMTGSVSSYFLFIGFILIGAYRIGHGYRFGLLAMGGMCAGHAAAFALEELGVVRAASIFVTDPGAIYDSDVFRWAAMGSIQASYAVAFLLANWVTAVFREKDAVAIEARREALLLAEQAQLGRFSGKVIAGKYELQELLGRGGMSEVYQARRVADDREVAVKILLTHLADEPELIARFRREAEVGSLLPAGMVAAVLDSGETEDSLQYIAMERLRGEDLAAHLRRRGQLPVPEVVAFLQRIAEILDLAHAQGIVHRDLKPQNVFLLPGDPLAPDLRLLDFGVARLVEAADATALTRTAALIGTPGYLAPEQARGRIDEIGPHTDVFALGSIVYRALTGVHAFPARSPEAAVYEVVHMHPRMPSEVCTLEPADLPPAAAADLDRALVLALAKHIHFRLKTAGAFADTLDRAARAALTPAERTRADSLRADAERDTTLADPAAS